MSDRHTRARRFDVFRLGGIFIRARGTRSEALPGASTFILRTTRVVLCITAAAATGIGCGWIGSERSVRFHPYDSEQDFGRLPPLPFSAKAPGTTDAHDDERLRDHSWYEATEQHAREIDSVWEKSRGALQQDDFEKTRKLLRDYLDGTFGEGGDAWAPRPKDRRERRNSAFDQLDALRALDAGSSPGAVDAYLNARGAYDAWVFGEVAGASADQGDVRGGGIAEVSDKNTVGLSGTEFPARALDSVPHDKNLEDNVSYLRAAVLYREGQTAEAARAFEAVAAKYPRSEKREAALFMAGVAPMKESGSFNGGTATSSAPCPECRDEAWSASRAAFLRLLSEYPRGRFAPEARSWLGSLALRVDDVAGGLAEYYRLLSDERSRSMHASALVSLRLARGLADDADMDRLEATLADEPDAALTYAYHNIYNYTYSDALPVEILAGDPHADDDSFASWQWRSRMSENIREAKQRAELQRVVNFATRLMRRHPNSKAGGAFALRVAQANQELGDEQAARELARRALARGVGGEERAAALWVKGVAEHRLRDYAASRRTLTSLINKYPDGDLVEGARRLLAMVAEDEGDLNGALEQYLALGYADDVAYFVDVLMTPEQFGEFIARRPDSPARDDLLYALGVRLMRARRWADARDTLKRVKTSVRLTTSTHTRYEDSGDDDPKHRFAYRGENYYGGGGTARGVLAGWVLRDLKTIDDLERLERTAETAEGDEAKAEALYQLASYLYEGSPLVFYNPAAWGGGRYWNLSSLDETKFRSPGEATLLWHHMTEHDSPARALTMYLEIVRRFPGTRAARDALYTAAVCHERLSNYNSYWRDIYGMGLHAGDRMVTYCDVRVTYPSYRLPLGTLGWEPSTRTVNGGPAWAAPPKRQPLTRADRARRRVKSLERYAAKGWELFGEVGGGRLRRWTLVVLILCGALVTLRATRRAHRLLFASLTRITDRRRAERALSLYAPASTYAAHLPYTSGAKFHAASRNVTGALWRLALDRRGRAALALNLITHALLSALVWAFAWALSMK